MGDASWFKDPLTAHGMTDALRDAELLARAILTGGESSLADYQAERDDFARDFLELSDRVASFDWNLDTVKSLHQNLSKQMNQECDTIRNWPTPCEPAAQETA